MTSLASVVKMSIRGFVRLPFWSTHAIDLMFFFSIRAPDGDAFGAGDIIGDYSTCKIGLVVLRSPQAQESVFGVVFGERKFSPTTDLGGPTAGISSAGEDKRMT